MSFDTGKGGQNGKKREELRLYQKRSDTVGEPKTDCKTGRESTILIRPKALIRAFGGFANSIRSLLEQPGSGRMMLGSMTGVAFV